MVIIIIYRCRCEEKYLTHAHHHHHAVYMPCLRALFTWPVYMSWFAMRGSINTTLMPHDNAL